MDSDDPNAVSSGERQRDFAEQLHRLWDSLLDFPAGNMDGALQHLLSGLCHIFDASAACWVGAIRVAERDVADELGGWRTYGFRRVTRDRSFELEALKTRASSRDQAQDLSIVRHMARAGLEFRAQRWCDLVESDWQQSGFFRDNYTRKSIADAVYVGFPLNESAESMISLLRGPSEPAFSERERDWIGYGMRGIKRFHRHLMLSYGLLGASATLTNTERKVLQQLLTGRTEKEVAAALALSYHTTHAHVTSILKKFGASNRPSLMSLWLNPSG